MKTMIGCGVALLLAVLAQGAAVVTVDGVTVDAAARRVRVDYTLTGGDAIVTASFTTNGVPVAAARSTSLVGDVNKWVRLGTNESVAVSFVWFAQNDLENLPACDVGVELALWSAANPPDYMAVNLAANSNVAYYASVDALPGGIDDDRWRVSQLLMRKIRARGVTYTMGAASPDTGRIKPHSVTLTNDFYIGVFELTQGQLVNIFGYNTYVQGFNWTTQNKYTNEVASATRPADNLIWRLLRGNDLGYQAPRTFAVDSWSILGYLRAKCGLEIDLPTEAMWEFACRGGTETQTFFEGTGLTLGDFARTAWNGGANNGSNWPREVGGDKATARVGSYRPNAYGLYDMYGNVHELCYDRGTPLTDGQAATDPLGHVSNNQCVARGGCAAIAATKWYTSAMRATPSLTEMYNPTLGDLYGARLSLRIYDLPEE